MPDIKEMIGKEVEVMSQGTTYRGVLIEVSDAEVHLRTKLQWVSLPVSAVGDVRLAEQPAANVADSIIAGPGVDDPA